MDALVEKIKKSIEGQYFENLDLSAYQLIVAIAQAEALGRIADALTGTSIDSGDNLTIGQMLASIDYNVRHRP